MLLSRRRKEWGWWLDWVFISCVDMGWRAQVDNGVLFPGRYRLLLALDVKWLSGFNYGPKMLDSLLRLLSPFQINVSAPSPYILILCLWGNHFLYWNPSVWSWLGGSFCCRAQDLPALSRAGAVARLRVPGTLGASQGEGRGSFELPRNLGKAKNNLGCWKPEWCLWILCQIDVFYHYCILFLVSSIVEGQESKAGERKKPNPKEPVNTAKQLIHESAMNERGRGRCFSFYDELWTENQFAICGKALGGDFDVQPKEFPTAPPLNHSSAWKAEPAVKAPCAGRLPCFILGKPEARCSVCALCPSLHRRGCQCFPTVLEFCGGSTYYFWGVWDAGVVGEHHQVCVMEELGVGELLLREKRLFSAWCGGVQNYKIGSCDRP